MEVRWIRAADAADIEYAQELMRIVFMAGCDRIDLLVKEMWGWEKLPARFDISADGWTKAEMAITEAADNGYWWDVVALGGEYIERVEKFCAGWRAQAKAKAKGSL